MRRTYSFDDLWYAYVKNRGPIKQTDKWEYEVDATGQAWMHPSNG